MKPDQLLVGRKLGVTVGGRQLLRNIDLQLNRRQILTIIGPNGAGKTTLVRLAPGPLQPTEGTVTRASGLKVGYAATAQSARKHASDGAPLHDADQPDPVREADAREVMHLLQRPMQGCRAVRPACTAGARAARRTRSSGPRMSRCRASTSTANPSCTD